MILEELQELEEQSIKRGIPIIGSTKGAWLLQKIKEVQPQRVLELGTANGYSGIILGSEGAELITIEIDKRIAVEAKKNFVAFNINARIVIGDAVQVAEKMARDENNEGAFDIVFIDFVKTGYLKVLENCICLVKKQGFIIADNITFDGCQDYRQVILNHPQLKTEIINIRDGLGCSRRVK